MTIAETESVPMDICFVVLQYLRDLRTYLHRIQGTAKYGVKFYEKFVQEKITMSTLLHHHRLLNSGLSIGSTDDQNRLALALPVEEKKATN